MTAAVIILAFVALAALAFGIAGFRRANITADALTDLEERLDELEHGGHGGRDD